MSGADCSSRSGVGFSSRRWYASSPFSVRGSSQKVAGVNVARAGRAAMQTDDPLELSDIAREIQTIADELAARRAAKP